MDLNDLITLPAGHDLRLRARNVASRLALLLCLVLPAHAEVPALLSYQGRIAVGTTAFDGTGQFKLALVNSGASQVYWLNAADGDNDGEPDQAVSVPVAKGLYSLLLGDTNLANMAAIPTSAFSNSEVYLRVWFNDGSSGFQLLNPDSRVASVGYALMAGNVPDGAVTTPKLAGELAATITSLTEQLTTLSNRLKQVENSGSAASIVVSTDASDSGLISQNFQRFSSTTEFSWLAGTAESSPAARSGHTAIWSGQEMIVWGGYLGANLHANSGGKYNRNQDSWLPVTTFGAPSARQSHSAIWTGSEMIVWGGLGASGYSQSGGRYQPNTQLWNAVANVGAPSARGDHSSLWTGARMLVWGGRSQAGYLADGALYDPVANQWIELALPGSPEARHSATAVWTGDQMIVWGGETASGPANSGKRLVFETDAVAKEWRTVSVANAPSARTSHSAVWTGSKMIVWGGRNGSSFLGDGAIYDPANDTWVLLPTVGAPSGRAGHAALWTGAEMLIYGGRDASGALSSGSAYDPSSNKWRSLSALGTPIARSGAKAVWSGTEFIVFGGEANGQPIAALQHLNPQPAWHFYRKL